jgi:drug/metabolite transporter (DMT)-like permease
MNEQSRHYLQGVLMIAAAGVCWSTAGVIVRDLRLSGWEVTFWRSAIMTVAALPVLLFYYRRRRVAADAPKLVLLASGVLLASTFVFFIMALAYANVANVLIVMASAPFLTAILGRIFIGERVNVVTWLAIAIAMAGIALTVVDALASHGWLGSLLAFLTALSFSINTIIVRRYKTNSMLPAIFLAGLFSSLAALPFALPLQAGWGDAAPLAFLACIQLGLGLVLFTFGARRIPGAQAGLIALLEPVLGPIWVWLAFAERPGDFGLIGGVLVVAAILLNALIGMRRREHGLATNPP